MVARCAQCGEKKDKVYYRHDRACFLERERDATPPAALRSGEIIEFHVCATFSDDQFGMFTFDAPRKDVENDFGGWLELMLANVVSAHSARLLIVLDICQHWCDHQRRRPCAWLEDCHRIHFDRDVCMRSVLVDAIQQKYDV